MSSATIIDSHSGRSAAIERRRALSAGKAALPPPRERSRSGERTAAVPALPAPVAPTAQAPVLRVVEPAVTHEAVSGRVISASGRELARARRVEMSRRGRGDQPPTAASRPPRRGKIVYAEKVPASPTHAGQVVTGIRIGQGRQTTGDEKGATLPVSGTQYIAADGGAPIRSAGPKVGLARTPAGLVVSGTLVRSNVRVTGDEAGSSIAITGESDQGLQDDLTPRAADGAYVSSQFHRQVDPHGHSVFGTNLGRSAAAVGSRDRGSRSPAVESTEAGRTITGSAVGRTSRVTGDEDGVCRHVTGNQYLTPARAQAECGGQGGGTSPAALVGTERPDPVTGAKVRVAQTWGQQRVSGTDLEYDPKVTGDAAGTCQAVTGTPYQGPKTVHEWCEPAQAEAALAQRSRSAAFANAQAAPAPAGTAVAPERPAWLPPTPWSAPARVPRDKREITGSFASRPSRLTGNTEFLYRPRTPAASDERPARAKLTGEGNTRGTAISGHSWGEHGRVTGTDGFFASGRNASERAGKPKPFAGARVFKAEARHDEPKQLVTGLLGWSGKTAAKVTLSGGAKG